MPPPPVQLRRDSFARATLIRERASDYYDATGLPCKPDCAYCGSRPGRFLYYWESDSGRVLSDLVGRKPRHVFCSVQCWENFNA